MIGLKRGSVALYPHEAAWDEDGRRTVKLLRNLFGSAAKDVQHVGSTAVAAISAKPIIDMAVGVDSFDCVAPLIPALEAAGVYRRPNGDDETQLLFVMGDLENDTRSHHIHVVIYGGNTWNDYINFRDYLNAFPRIAAKYEALKIKLAAEFPNDRKAYTAGKAELITFLKRRALVWSYYGKTITAEIDRPIGYIHKKKTCTFVYTINYGFIPGVMGGDGEELDVYVLGVDKPLGQFTGRVIAAALREDDNEDKLIAAPEGMSFTADEIAAAIAFQEYRHKTRVVTAAEIQQKWE